MKLEPSHLIPYLPYGLNMYNPRDGRGAYNVHLKHKIRNMNKIEISDYLDTSFDLEISLETEDYSQNIDLYDGYKIVQKLHEWHFDTQSLIKKELAININTVEL